jgi:hypothetical protein
MNLKLKSTQNKKLNTENTEKNLIFLPSGKLLPLKRSDSIYILEKLHGKLSIKSHIITKKL